MKKVLKYAISLLFVAFSATSCWEAESIDVINEREYRASFLAQTAPSVSIGGEVISTFDKVNEQISFVEDHSSYMVSDINNTKYYTLYIDNELLLDAKVKVLCDSKDIEGLKEYSDGEMKVLKIDAEKGLIWIWDKDATVGFVLQIIKG